MIRSSIIDGNGSGREAIVTPNYALKTQNVPETSVGIPPEDLANLRLYRNFLRNGTSADANVDGSVTAVEFTVQSVININVWITGVRFLFEGTNLEMNTQDFRRFGAATTGGSPLTNGVLFRTIQSGETIEIFSDPIVYVGDFFTYANNFLNLANSISAQSDFLSFDFNFEKPVVLPEGGNDSIRMVIQDDLTAIDKFQVLLFGYQEFTS